MTNKTKNQKKKNKAIVTIASCAMIGALGIAGTLAYMTDSDLETNTFTFGNVDIDLTEPTFAANSTDNAYLTELTPNAEVEKDPTITNIGVNDAVVFATVDIPVAAVHKVANDGTIADTVTNEELFIMKTDGAIGVHDYAYDSDNWTELESKKMCLKVTASGKEEVDSTLADLDMSALGDGEYYVVRHVYAFNEALQGSTTNDDTPFVAETSRVATTTLFDKVQLINFAEDESKDGVTDNLSSLTKEIFVQAYGIQDSNIILADSEVADWSALADKEEIYDIYIAQNDDDVTEL